MREQLRAVGNFAIFHDFRNFFVIFRDFRGFFAIFPRIFRDFSLALARASRIAKNTGVQNN